MAAVTDPAVEAVGRGGATLSFEAVAEALGRARRLRSAGERPLVRSEDKGDAEATRVEPFRVGD